MRMVAPIEWGDQDAAMTRVLEKRDHQLDDDLSEVAADIRRLA